MIKVKNCYWSPPKPLCRPRKPPPDPNKPSQTQAIPTDPAGSPNPPVDAVCNPNPLIAPMDPACSPCCRSSLQTLLASPIPPSPMDTVCPPNCFYKSCLSPDPFMPPDPLMDTLIPPPQPDCIPNPPNSPASSPIP